MAVARLSLVERVALFVITLVALADLFTYATPDAFLGKGLGAQGASTPEIMAAYGVSGGVTAIAGILVLLCQSIPSISRLSPGSNWALVVAAQSLSVASSAIILTWPVTPAVIAARAIHGAATAGYMIYCLILLVELSPKKRLAMGIAALTAGMTAGDSIAPVVGAIIYDRAGFRAAFVPPAVLSTLVLLLVVLMFPIWHWSPAGAKQLLLQRSYSSSINIMLPTHTLATVSSTSAGPTVTAVSEGTGPTAATVKPASSGTGTQGTVAQDVPSPFAQHTCQLMRGSSTDSTGSTYSSDESNSYSSTDTDSHIKNTLWRMPSFSHRSNTLLLKNLFSLRQHSISRLNSLGSFRKLRSFRLVQLAQLDMASIFNTIKDPVIFCQCLLLFLEQSVRSALTVVLPATMGSATWLVGVVYIANVVGAVLSPFVVDRMVSRYSGLYTHILSAILGSVMGISSVLVISFGTKIPILVVLLFLYGASQSAVETLVYVHVAKRLEVLGHHTTTHVSMCMYMLAQTAGGGAGSLTGGALQQQTWGVQLGIMGLGAGIASGFGIVLGLKSHKHRQQQGGAAQHADVQVVIEQCNEGGQQELKKSAAKQGCNNSAVKADIASVRDQARHGGGQVAGFNPADSTTDQHSSEATETTAVAAMLQKFAAINISDSSLNSIREAALACIQDNHLSDSFYIYDPGQVVSLYHTWVSAMPRVEPYYAVKCNPEPAVVAVLHAMGAGFDCASVKELELAASVDAPQDKIIFANPCKRPVDFRYAQQNDVHITTFDSLSELEKIAAGCPGLKCVLRIRCDDPDAKINLGLKYGADLEEVPQLLNKAKELSLQVTGVSFHVGSGCQNVSVYADAIAAARRAFDLGLAAGFRMELLDIGGGFTAPYDASNSKLFQKTAEVINEALEVHFPPDCGARVIAEPGRYFAETSATLFATIWGQRETVAAEGSMARAYCISDSTYGNFRIQVAVDGLEPEFGWLRSPLLADVEHDDGTVLYPSQLIGSSGQDDDLICKDAQLPDLRVGDWLMFPNAGAYTVCAASNYGGTGCAQPDRLFVYSQSNSNHSFNAKERLQP